MRINGSRMSRPLLALMLILASGSSAFAQGSKSKPQTVPVSEEFLKAAELAIAERDHLKVTVELKDQQIAALKDQIGALNGLAQIQSARAEAWAKAATERTTALASDDKVFRIQGEEITRLRTERDKARSAQKVWGFGGVIIGVTLGILSQRRN